MGGTCLHCGREHQGRESFCLSCGAFLHWDAGQLADSPRFVRQGTQPNNQRAAVQIRLENDLIVVAPGGAESTVYVIKNLGTKVEQFRLSVTGPDWLAVDPAVISVYPGQEATGVVQAAPPRKPGSTAGVTPFRLTVTSALHSHVSSSAAGRVDVSPFDEFAAELAPSSSRGRGWTRHTVTLKNGSNLPLRILLTPADVADGLRLSAPADAEVAPGEVTEVPVAVHGPFRWFGRPEPRTFSITAEPPKPLPPARLSGTRVVVPVFPKWVPVAAAGVLAAAVAAAAVAPKLMAHNGPSQSRSASSNVSSRHSSSQGSGSHSSSQGSGSQSSSQGSGSHSSSQGSGSHSSSQGSGSHSPSQGSGSQSSSQSSSPTISGVSFTGDTAAPTMTISGRGFGATQPTGVSDNSTSCGNYAGNGEDYEV
jgi:hypothetical protein